MNKELGRKITSLTLMTIMLAGGVSFAIAPAMPEAEAANQHLWVSAEAQGNNFYGAQVLEIVVTDPAINRLDEAYGMPDVTIAGSKVIMAQGVDGSWYAYIADGAFATAVDALYPEVEDGMGADFGSWCKPATNLEYAPYASATKNVAQLIPSESRGVAIPHQLGNGSATAGSTLGWEGNVSGVVGGTAGTIGDATQSSYTKGTGITGKCDNDVDGAGAGVEGSPGVWLNATSNVAHKGYGLATGVNATDQAINNVVREARALSNGTTTDFYGNIALGPNLWPFIQVYDFSRYVTYDLVYEKGGADEVVALTFDRPSGQGLSFDKPQYGLLHEVGITLTNGELNIDPTDEDSWTYATNPASAATYYQLFDENGTAEADNTNGAIKNTNTGMQGTWGSDEGVLLIDRNGPNDSTYNVIKFQDNGDTVLTCTSQSNTAATGCSTNDIAALDAAVTFTETGANTGVFTNWDDGLVTNMYISEVADRGTQAVVTFNDQAYSVLHMPFWGTVAYDTEYGDGIGAEWNAGEIVGVVVNDEDMNFDARNLDQQAISSNTTIVPSIKIGSPITLKNADVWSLYDGGLEGTAIVLDENMHETQCSSNYAGSGTDSSYTSCYEKYSERAIFTTGDDTSDITLATGDIFRFKFNGTTVGDLKDLISGSNGTAAFTYIQYDLRSIVSSNDYYLNFTIGDSSLDDRDKTTVYGHAVDNRYSTGTVGSALFNAPGAKVQGFGSLTDSENLEVDIEINLLNSVTGATLDATGQVYPLVMDFVTFGQSNDGVQSSDRHNNAIYRLEVDETGANSGEYLGELEYIMLNQINVNQTSTYNATKHWDDATVIIVHNDLTDEDEVRINYLDMGADGVETQVADQLAAPTHSGVVELDNDSYKEADTVVVTLTDSDLNTNPDIINIYSVVTTVGSTDQYDNSLSDFNDPAYDSVGQSGYGSNSVGDNNGRLLDITFDDEQWLKAAVANGSGVSCTGTPGGDDGLAASGFSLVETGANTGVFIGDFQVPAEYCARSSGTGTVTSSMGTDIEVNYVDYRDASGEIIEVGDGAGIRGNTGSVSLDRTVYPVPFGTIGDFSSETAKSTPNSRSVYPIHSGGITSFLDASTETIGNGDLTIHIRVDDPRL